MRNDLLGALAVLVVIATPAVAGAGERLAPPCMEGETCGTVGEYLAHDERPRPLGDLEADPLGLLRDEDGQPLDDAIAMPVPA